MCRLPPFAQKSPLVVRDCHLPVSGRTCLRVSTSVTVKEPAVPRTYSCADPQAGILSKPHALSRGREPRWDQTGLFQHNPGMPGSGHGEGPAA